VFILNGLAGTGALFNMLEACLEKLTNTDWAVILLLKSQIASKVAIVTLGMKKCVQIP
jgi:hypothetical protein